MPSRGIAPLGVSTGATVADTVSLAAALRMPLAIVRKQVEELPFDFQFDDRTAMSPATRLSALPKLVINARISQSGSAVPQPRDLARQTAPSRPAPAA